MRCEKGKLVARRGRKARGLPLEREVARLPNTKEHHRMRPPIPTDKQRVSRRACGWLAELPEQAHGLG